MIHHGILGVLISPTIADTAYNVGTSSPVTPHPALVTYGQTPITGV